MKRQTLGALNALVMSAKADTKHVEKDAEGNITAMRILPYGKLTLQKAGGTPMTLDVTEPYVDKVIAAHADKGVKLPIDCEHSAFYLAEKLKKTEAEVLAMTGYSALAMGYFKPAKRADGLWAEEIEWNEPGKAIVASGICRYYSPVMRLAGDDYSFLTSFTLTKLPMINKLAAIACAVDVEDAATGTPGEGEGEAAIVRIAKMLNLPEDSDAPTVISALELVLQKFDEQNKAQEAIAASALAQQDLDKKALIAKGIAEGRFVNADVPKLEALAMSAVKAIYEIVPKKFEPGKSIAASAIPQDEKTKELTEEDIKNLKASGASDEQIERIKRGEELD